MAATRGRGYTLSRGTNGTTVPELRRPGAGALRHRLGISEPEAQVDVVQPESPAVIENLDDKYENICQRIGKINLSSAEETSSCAEDLKLLCDTPEKLQSFCEHILQFALKSKWNAHVVALFCNNHGDIAADTVKLKFRTLSALQGLYNERNKTYINLDRFVSEVAFFCELFHHLRINDKCVKALVQPLLDYLGMLVDGASFKEVEVFVEQFPKCFPNLKEHNPDGIDALLLKIRKQIVSDTTTVTVKAMLLEMFEMILTDWRPLDQNAKFLYESLSRPITKTKCPVNNGTS